MQTLFTSLDHLISRVPGVNPLISCVATKVLPQQKAYAGGAGDGYYVCGSSCGSRGYRVWYVCSRNAGTCDSLGCQC